MTATGWVQQKTQGGIPDYTLKELSIMTDIWLCWVNSIGLKESGTDPTFDNQRVRASK